MKWRVSIAVIAAICLGAAAARAEVVIGVGAVGPISPGAENEIVQEVGALPGVHATWIQPPSDVDDAVKRFVAVDARDRLDGIVVVSLPPDSFQVQQDSSEARFTGHYEIWTLNLSTLGEDHHQFTFSDTETVVSGPASFLSIPAQLFVERATGQKVLSTNSWQAYEAIQTRVEAKLVAATRLYLTTASIRDTQPLNLLTCAQALVDRGDSDAALLVFKTAGVDNPEVRRLMAAAEERLKRAKAEALLGQALGALAGGDQPEAGILLAAYERTPASEPARAAEIRAALGRGADHAMDPAERRALAASVPSLDQSAFVAMVSELFQAETGAKADQVILADRDVVIVAKEAGPGMKKHLDDFAATLGKAAYLTSLRCNCDAGAAVVPDPAGETLLRARYAPSFAKPEVGLP
ncbi:MAG TPA: hypothetical protein VEJ86_05930 [Candidatus Binataceae bacterium]|nr:hypothetical protein [Candidatus Binataceae bacterium]